MQRSVRTPLIGRASGLMLAAVNIPAAGSGYAMARLVSWLGWSTASVLQMTLLTGVAAVAMLFFSPRQTDRPRRGGFFGIADKPVARSLTS